MRHIFDVKENSIMYLPEYKQAFNMVGDDKVMYENGMIDELQFKYIGQLNEQDFAPPVDIKTTRYGLFLNVANACNARCVYCFAHQGDYGKTKGKMTKQVANNAIDEYFNVLPEYADGFIIFFGGEPLISEDTIREAVKHTKNNYKGKRRYSFHIVTNATLLTRDFIDFMAENNFGVAISIDGGEEVQNAQRPLANGRNSFYEATKNLDYLLNKIENVHARGTYCDFSISLAKMHEELLDLGFKEVNIPPDILNSDVTFGEIEHQMNELYDYMVNYTNKTGNFPFGLFVEHIRRLFMPKMNAEYTCGLGETTFSIDINGDVYPCHRFSSEDSYRMGNIDEGIEIKKFDFSSKQCNECWNQYTCSHGCSYNDYVITGDENKKNKNWCFYSKKMTELSLSLLNDLPSEVIDRILFIESNSQEFF